MRDNSYDVIIQNHYDSVAKVHGDSASSTMEDAYVRNKESSLILEIISKFHKNNADFNLIDVGCGNGYTLSLLRKNFSSANLFGVEYNKSLRKIAEDRFENLSVKISAGDVRNFDTLPEKSFDIVICQRVLINILNKNDQFNALNNILKLAKQNGIFIFIESFLNGLKNLNAARNEFGLENMNMAHHNLYLEDDFFKNIQLKPLDLVNANIFSSHYFISRVLHQSFLSSMGKDFSRNSHFVSFFSNAFPESVGEYSPLKVLAFQKN